MIIRHISKEPNELSELSSCKTPTCVADCAVQMEMIVDCCEDDIMVYHMEADRLLLATIEVMKKALGAAEVAEVDAIVATYNKISKIYE